MNTVVNVCDLEITITVQAIYWYSLYFWGTQFFIFLVIKELIILFFDILCI